LKQLAVIGTGVLLLPVILISAAFGALGAQQSSASAIGVGAFDIPAEMAAFYVEAANHFGISASVLAGIGKVECDHRNLSTFMRHQFVNCSV